MRLGLGKFWHHGRLKKKHSEERLEEGVRRTAWVAGNRILRAMLKVKILEEIHISGVSEGGLAFISDCGGTSTIHGQRVDDRGITRTLHRINSQPTRAACRTFVIPPRKSGSTGDLRLYSPRSGQA